MLQQLLMVKYQDAEGGSEVAGIGEDSGILLALSSQSAEPTFLMLRDGYSDGSPRAPAKSQWP